MQFKTRRKFQVILTWDKTCLDWFASTSFLINTSFQICNIKILSSYHLTFFFFFSITMMNQKKKKNHYLHFVFLNYQFRIGINWYYLFYAAYLTQKSTICAQRCSYRNKWDNLKIYIAKKRFSKLVGSNIGKNTKINKK